MPKPYRTTLLAGLLALVCAGVLWAAYDWFQGRYLRAFNEHTAVFSGDPLQLPSHWPGPAQSAWCTSGTQPARATSATSNTWAN